MPEHHPSTQLLADLRRYMQTAGLDAFVVPTADPHGSEYLPAHYAVRARLTGFDGSAGTAVVTPSAAALWTDSRYFLQAARQLAGTPFTLQREGVEGVPSVAEWIAGELSALPTPADGGARVVGIVAETCSRAEFLALASALPAHVRLAAIDDDPFRAIWPQRPPLPAAQVYVQPAEWTSRGFAEKRDAVFAALDSAGRPAADALVVDDLSEIAWLTGLRGGDVDYNPVFMAYLLLTRTGATLFSRGDRFTPEALAQLAADGSALQPYAAVFDALEAWAPGRLALTETANMRLVEAARRAGHTMFAASPVPALRAVKDEAEQAGFRRAVREDGAAMAGLLRRLDETALREAWTEQTVDEVLTALRAARPGFRSLSFATIAGYGPHGAIVHYEATPATAARLEARGLLLIDSGAHYASGTTDLTRTVALGPVSDEERRVCTLVMKGHVALARMRFPEGTVGLQLDTAARAAMWSEGYDFGHGTGHGVGSVLPVHEGPLQIRKNVRPCTLLPVEPGQVVTDEPGVYVEGRFGVRIENMLLCRRADTTPFGRFLRFETLTLCPYDLRTFDLGLFTPDEIAWIDDYHALCRRELMPLLSDEADRRWLEAATRPVAEVSAGMAAAELETGIS